MRGDEAEPTAAGGDRTRERSGPRHAAPRKSLLTKLQMPAGKAMALAAMPTAVFVGMGLTPKLALADDQVTNPFAPGPCVTRSDIPDPDASESTSPAAKPTPTATPSPGTTPDEPAETPGAGESPKPGETPDASSSAPATEPTKEPEAGKTTTPAPMQTPTTPTTPTESETKNPLDPLGVGDAIKDVLDGPDKETTAPEPSKTEPSDTEPADGGSATDKPDDAENPDDADNPDADKPATEKPKDAADKTADAIRDAAEKAGAKVEELGDEAKGTADKAADADDPAANADGKEPFPCPTADPEALANAELEQGIPDLPDDPWVLESSMLTLRGLDYKGIVEVRTGSGKIKKVLKFTAKETDIKDLHQKVVGPNGTTAHVQAARGSTSTIREGTVTMYTEELKGNLFGLIPVTFSPETPPPLNVPIAMFTKVKVTQAGQFGGTLKVPGLHNFFTG